MHKLKFILTCLLLGSFLPLSGAWNLGVKNHLDPSNNTRVLLDYSVANDRDKEFIAEVSFREEKSHRVVLSKEVRLKANGSQLFELFFNVPVGFAYQVDV